MVFKPVLLDYPLGIELAAEAVLDFLHGVIPVLDAPDSFQRAPLHLHGRRMYVFCRHQRIEAPCSRLRGIGDAFKMHSVDREDSSLGTHGGLSLEGVGLSTI